jgi:hypothetical protein
MATMTKEAMIEACAELAHEANRICSSALGDKSHRPWLEAPDWQKVSSRHGIMKALDGARPEALHDSWCEEKRRAGWSYGPVKDEALKTHPCLVPYAELPETQRRKDYLYQRVVRAMRDALTAEAFDCV